MLSEAVHQKEVPNTSFKSLSDTERKKMFELIADSIEAESDERILNIGCGCGGLSNELKKRGLDVTMVTKGWQKSFTAFDVIVATHLHSFSDIKHMCRLAKKRVYITSSADIGVKLFEDSHKEVKDIFDNLSGIFNMLYMYGINPNVKIIKTVSGYAVSIIYWDI